MSRPPAVETFGLSKHFGNTTALQDLNLNIPQGQMFAMVGPDGAGKTTLLRLLCGILEPSGGRARILGLELGREIGEIKRRIGYFSQGFSLYGDLSVDENIEFFAEIHGVHRYRDLREQLLEFTRLKPFRKRLAERLSGGMKQKLALACTLIHRPALLFLDEPTTGVDPVSRRDFWVILTSLLREEITILLTTPYLDEAERCHRVGMLQAGRLLVADTPAALKAGLKGAFLEVVCSETRRAYALLKGQKGLAEIQVFGDRLNILLGGQQGQQESIRLRLEQEGIHIAALRLIQPRLENVFISLMQAEREKHEQS
jgi:ABC-2 type transport system ATP-binding protein